MKATVKKAIEEVRHSLRNAQDQIFQREGQRLCQVVRCDLSLATAKLLGICLTKSLIPLANQVLKMMEEQFRPDDRPTDTVNEIGNTVREASLIGRKGWSAERALCKSGKTPSLQKGDGCLLGSSRAFTTCIRKCEYNAFLGERKKGNAIMKRDLVKFEPVPVKNATHLAKSYSAARQHRQPQDGELCQGKRHSAAGDGR